MVRVREEKQMNTVNSPFLCWTHISLTSNRLSIEIKSNKCSFLHIYQAAACYTKNLNEHKNILRYVLESCHIKLSFINQVNTALLQQ